jgi:hypothetical protein
MVKLRWRNARIGALKICCDRVEHFVLRTLTYYYFTIYYLLLGIYYVHTSGRTDRSQSLESGPCTFFWCRKFSLVEWKPSVTGHWWTRNTTTLEVNPRPTEGPCHWYTNTLIRSRIIIASIQNFNRNYNLITCEGIIMVWSIEICRQDSFYIATNDLPCVGTNKSILTPDPSLQRLQSMALLPNQKGVRSTL